MNGKELFQLSKTTLDQFTNETESSKIHALLSQQKKLSGVKFIFLINEIHFFFLVSIWRYI
jgi:hypothetical protein